MGGSVVTRRKAWAIASLGGLGAMVLGAILPGASASGAGPTSRPREPVDPDVSPADDVSTGEFQSCSAYYGWGKSWAHVQVAVNGEVDDDISFPADYQLVLTGDLDDGTPGEESCIPERLTQADWDADFTGPNTHPYNDVTTLPPGDNIVIPGPTVTAAAVAGSPLQLIFDGDFPGLQIEVDSASVPNFQDLAAYDAEYSAYLVAVLGEPNATNFQTECGGPNATPEQVAAADAAFAAMDPAFQADYQSIAGMGDFSSCFNYGNIQQYFSEYWFPYAWGTENPVTFALGTEPPTPITPSAITFTG